MSKFGRPSKKEKDKAKFRIHNFYYPVRLEDVWNEFDDLCQKEIPRYPYRERCKSLVLRRLLLKFVLEKTDKEEIKNMIKEFVGEETQYLNKLKK